MAGDAKSTEHGEQMMALAGRFFDAIESGDIETVRSLYADDVVIWHNHDRATQTRDENLRVLGWMAKRVTERRYTDTRRSPTPEGFVQQHVLTGTWPTGAALELAACIVCQVRDGRITRLDEYFDPAALPPFG